MLSPNNSTPANWESRPGTRIAITVGSGGVANITRITRAVVAAPSEAAKSAEVFGGENDD